MATQIRFNTPTDLANSIIAKLNGEELSMLRQALMAQQVNVNETVDVETETVSTKSEASQDKMWLYAAKRGWALDVRKSGMVVQNAAKRLEKEYKCEIIAIKNKDNEGKINFVPTNSNTIMALVEKGVVVYRPELNKRPA